MRFHILHPITVMFYVFFQLYQAEAIISGLQ